MLRPPPSPTRGNLVGLATWMGIAGFGGGYAVLAQLRTLTVERNGWLSEDEYLEAVTLSQSLPGASGANFFTQLALRRTDVLGAALVTAAFLAPSAALMILLGVFYDRARGLDHVEAVFAGMNPAVVAVVATVAAGLARKLRERWQVGLALASFVAVALGVGVLDVVVGVALLGVVVHVAQLRTASARPPGPLLFLPGLLVLPSLAQVFLRIGAASFGGGLAIIPVLDHQVVDTLHWLTPHEFTDAITLGQITPGPVAICATFIGYRVAGLAGALVATVCTFLPPFVSSVVVGRVLQREHRPAWVDLLFRLLAPVTVGIVAAATLSLARASLLDGLDWVVALSSLFLLIARVPTLAVLGLAAAMRVATMVT